MESSSYSSSSLLWFDTHTHTHYAFSLLLPSPMNMLLYMYHNINYDIRRNSILLIYGCYILYDLTHSSIGCGLMDKDSHT